MSNFTIFWSDFQVLRWTIFMNSAFFRALNCFHPDKQTIKHDTSKERQAVSLSPLANYSTSPFKYMYCDLKFQDVKRYTSPWTRTWSQCSSKINSSTFLMEQEALKQVREVKKWGGGVIMNQSPMANLLVDWLFLLRQMSWLYIENDTHFFLAGTFLASLIHSFRELSVLLMCSWFGWTDFLKL